MDGRADLRPVEPLLPALRSFTRAYFDFDVQGFEHIPEAGPALLVANHSGGGWSPDAAAFVIEFLHHFGVDRPLHFLGHSALMKTPGLGDVLGRFGVVPASRDAAHEALVGGACVMVFPGGELELHRPFWARDQIRFQGRTGFLELAAGAKVPLVPVVMSGAQRTFLPLADGRRIARWTGLRRLTGIKVVPVAAGLPWGLTVANLLGWLPLPAHVRAEVLEPMDVAAYEGGFDQAYDDVTGRMQASLSALADQR